ncbi:MAG TPA: condensation domain-containing protein, partial [Bacteroidia bacterium]|nr:condensation domain-containing protein [Bacteroidia bacterium]
IILGTTVAGRNHPDLENLIGIFINTIAFKTTIQPEQTFVSLVEQTHQHLLEDIQHQDLPFELLLQNMDIKRTPSITPLFQSRFVFDEFESKDKKSRKGELKFKETAFEWKSAKFDLSTYIFKEKNRLSGIIEYRADLFKKQTIQQFIKQFITTLENSIMNPHAHLNELEMLTKEDKDELKNKKEEKTRKRLSLLKKTVHQ